MRRSLSLIRWFSIALLLGAVGLTFIELVAYSRQRARLPSGLQIADVPVGELTSDEAGQRLLQVYGAPIEVHYQKSLFYLWPAEVGFSLDLETMLAGADLYRTEEPFWSGFWDFLWSQPGQPHSVPLKAEFSQAQLRAVLSDIAARYDQPGAAPQPIPGSPDFAPGSPGTLLNLAQAEERLASALVAAAPRQVDLPINSGQVTRPTLGTLRVLAKQILQVDGFDGLMDLYMLDLQTGEDLHMITQAGQDLALEPDVAFSAASIVKIGILVSVYRYLGDQLDPEAQRWLEQMITLSGNDPSDWLMQRIDKARGPLKVTEMLSQLGLANTFLAGYYHPGSPVLQQFSTPANQRPDINTQPDPYIQTTPTDIGGLLADIYQCAQGGGTLRVVFPEQISPGDCNQMLELLSRNKIGVLIEAGVPDGTRVAHKHGWTEEAAGLGALGDAAVVFTPGGDYVLAVFLWKDNGMVWERDSKVVADLSRATYNYFNLPTR